ncbi:hypothetical protein [Pseudomonas sp. CCC2.2]|uniref:hypothetical protein n=1 Tax=Pseudomonas sp. CCC2.2 TaxID=3048605 RepID=UPI002B22C5B9|nr:hypothetical protein [Pseudomonas sp. CCC2.2]MEB0149049.1 hypothetical protein [Pseudomonas sp. CCC2.2]
MATPSKSKPAQSQLFQPDAAHLAYLINDATIWYATNVANERSEYHGGFVAGALFKFSPNSLTEMLALYATKIAEGYTASHHAPTHFAGPTGSYCSFVMTKPEAIRTVELKSVIAKAEQDYLAELEAERNMEVERQVELRFATEQRAAEAIRVKEEQQTKQRLRDEVLAALSGAK